MKAYQCDICGELKHGSPVALLGGVTRELSGEEWELMISAVVLSADGETEFEACSECLRQLVDEARSA